MGERGAYAKGIAKRAEILDAALTVIARDGYSGATVKEIATAVGLSQNGLLHYFGSKDALFTEILRHHDARLAATIGHDRADLASDLRERIVRAGAAGVEAPGMSQLQLALTTAASEREHVAHALIGERYRTSREITRETLGTLQRRGDLPDDLDPAIVATLLLAVLDGIQLQWLHDETIDVSAHLDHLLTILGVPPQNMTRTDVY